MVNQYAGKRGTNYWELPALHRETIYRGNRDRRGCHVTVVQPAGRSYPLSRLVHNDLGLPYQWGGDGPTAGDTGFDCSGLTHAAYHTASRLGSLLDILLRRAHPDLGCGPCALHLADQPVGVTCTTIRRPHWGQYRGGSSCLRWAQLSCWPLSIGRPQASQQFITSGRGL